MHRGRNGRLDRLIRRGGEADAAADRHRVLLARAAIGAAVRLSLVESGIDPAGVPALRVADEASAELAATGDPPSPSSGNRRANARDLPVDTWLCRDDGIGRLVARYRGGVSAAPDLARSSLAELLAWCIAGVDST